jgi:hypothetical protein
MKAKVIDRNYARMRKRCCNFCFTMETLGRVVVRQKVFANQFESHLAIQSRVAGLVYGAHATTAQSLI